MTAKGEPAFPQSSPTAPRHSGGRRLENPVTLQVGGLVLLAITSYIELSDSDPRAQTWFGAGAAVAFLLAFAAARGDLADVLASRGRSLFGAGVSAVLAVIGLWQASQRNEPRVLLLLAPSLLFFVTAMLTIRESARTSRAVRAGELRSRLNGEEAERRRWARELHDQTLQDLAAIEIRLGALANSRDAEVLAAGLQDTRVMAREQIRILRHLITMMRPLALDTLGLAAALTDLAHRAQEANDLMISCDVEQLKSASPDLGPDASVAIYRIVQEAVTNAVRHAACRSVTISARVTGSLLWLRVQDDGIGIDQEPRTVEADARPRVGMVGMAERAEAIGAHLIWCPGESGGTQVVLTALLRPRA